MINELILIVTAFIIGSIAGITSFVFISVLYVILIDFKIIQDYKEVLGTLFYVLTMPLTIGSFWEYYKIKKVNFYYGNIILIFIILGSWISSKLVILSNINEKTMNGIILFFITFINLRFAYKYFKNF